jgi:amidase
MRSFFEKYDAYMTPTLANPHIKLGSLLPSNIEDFGIKLASKLNACFYIKPIVKKIALNQLSAFPFTQLANQTGLPAMSIPVGISSKNIPLGVHFMSGYAKDHLLLRLARQLEETPIWFSPQKK